MSRSRHRRSALPQVEQDQPVPPLQDEGGAAPLLASIDPPPAPKYEPPPPPPKKPAEPEVELIGSALRRFREQQGETIESIAEYLRIRPAFIVALENNRYEELPADAYVVGFLRSYADYLRLDGRVVVEQYRREMAGQSRKPELHMPQPIAETRAPTAAILIGGTLVAFMVYALWYSVATSERTVVSAPPPLPSLETPLSPLNATMVAPNAPAIVVALDPTKPTPSSALNVPTQGNAVSATPSVTVPSGAPTVPPVAATTTPPAASAVPPVVAVAPSPAPPPSVPPDLAAALKGQVYGDPQAPSRLMLRATQESWILVADRNGASVFNKLLMPGDVYKVPNLEGLTLTSGNSGGIAPYLDNADLSRLTEDSRVVRNVPLDPDRLKAWMLISRENEPRRHSPDVQTPSPNNTDKPQ